MKKVLIATTALVMTAGYAAAEVTVGGDGRMGVIYDGNDLNFTSRARVSFTMTGESDAGLSFGASMRVDQEDEDGGSASRGGAGTVYISGTYGELTFGDVDSAAHTAVGHIDGVGLTGLGDQNEMTYIASGFDGNDNPGALYEYTAGALTVYASMNDGADDFGVDGNNDTVWSVAAKYAMDNYTAALGYEKVDIDGVAIDHWALGGSGTFGGVTVKATYGEASDLDFTQYGISGMYDAGAVDVTAFYMHKEVAAVDSDAFGLGAAYDLGGGATLKGGIVSSDANELANGEKLRADMGVAFTF